MLRTIFLTRLGIRGTGLTPTWRPTPARVLSVQSTSPGGLMDDKDANKAQMEQLNKQMEDVILKEKQVHDSEQVDKSTKTWDVASSSPEAPPESTSQSKTQEMGAIFDEQVKLAKDNMLHGQKHSGSGNNNLNEFEDYRDNPGTNDNKKMIDKVKDTVAQASENMMGMGHDLKEATKQSMADLKDMAKGMMSPPSTSGDVGTGVDNKGLVGDMKTAGQQTLKDIGDAAKRTMNTPAGEADAQREAEESKFRHGALEPGDLDGKKKKPFGERRENSSLL